MHKSTSLRNTTRQSSRNICIFIPKKADPVFHSINYDSNPTHYNQQSMRKIKQGKTGAVAKYISRSKAIRKLQLSLKDFRKLCILKGVYPREPPKKLKKNNRAYYHLKDINFLSLDPIIERIRAQKIFRRRFKTAKAKGEVGKIRYLSAHKPTVSLTHLVRERYPSFLDALRDLDDPLSLLALFTIFATHKQFGLTAEKIEASRQLLRHFQLYVIRTNSLRKAFVSVKGIYYQAEILGQKVTYVTPFKYPPTLPIDVDYKVMATFLEFYIVLLKFVNFKLFGSIGLAYPPIENDSSTYNGYEFVSLPAASTEDADKYKIDEEFKQQTDGSNGKLFSNLCFYLSTETPTESLEYIILSQGGKIELTENHAGVTHVITDREGIKRERTKQYLQPQWVYDSLNFQQLLSVKEYQIGKTLPPHVSPFVDQNDVERYIPERQKELRGILAPKTVEERVDDADQYDVVTEKKSEAKKKKQDAKDLVGIAKNIMSNKNRKLLRNIEMGKSKKAEAIQKLEKKSQRLVGK